MHTNGIIEEEEVVAVESEKSDAESQVGDKQNKIDSTKESGVDMAFDALMDLQENADLANFMKSHMDDTDDVQELWTINSHKEVVTNQWTGQILR